MADRIPTVMPGERFTAVLMNQLIEALLTLDQRTAALEGRGSVVIPPSLPVAIAQLVPSDEIKVGEELRVFGANFGYSSGSIQVAIGNTPIVLFKAGSNDSTLVFDVPGLTDALPATIQVSVSNGATSAGRLIAVKPATQLSGNVGIVSTLVDPPDESKTATWRVRLTSQATQYATFGITAAVSQAEWQSGLKVVADALGTTPLATIDLTPNQPRDVYVRLAIPTGAAGNSFTLTFAVTSGAAGGTSTSPTFTVGKTTSGTASGVAYGIITASISGRFNPVTHKVTLRPRIKVTLTINAAISIAGTYTLSSTLAPTDLEGWSATAVSPTGSFTVTAAELQGRLDVARQLIYEIAASEVATGIPSSLPMMLPISGGGGNGGGDGGGDGGGNPTVPVGGGPGTLEITLQRQSQGSSAQPETLVLHLDNT